MTTNRPGSGAAKSTGIAFEGIDGVAVVTLDRPERRNAVDRAMVHELIAAIDRAEADAELGAIVITGAGTSFCAGADLSAGVRTFADDLPDATAEDFRDFAGQATLRLFECTKPVIGAVNGAAVGFGASLVCAMDIRLAADTATFGFAYARRGMVPEGASGWFLPRLVGAGRALEWTLTGRLVGAAEARDAGLVNAVHPAADVVTAAIDLAGEIIRNSAPVSLAISRELLWKGLVADHPRQVHEADSRATFERGRSPDVAEGIDSFLQKRVPHFPQTLEELPPLHWPDDCAVHDPALRTGPHRREIDAT
ncbi:enoyl-CoA hydratase-related protein [Streptomyces sp. NPDC056296]|uniref:enoyl-CoA hydratase-related protein n=1 Tax=Streptomyces sp. NPDC056296 TaxID=3345775 RepID=UPI0035DC97B2